MKKIVFILAVVLISSVQAYADQTVYVEKTWYNYNYQPDAMNATADAIFMTTAPTVLTPGQTFYAEGYASRLGYYFDARPGGGHECPQGVGCDSSFVFGHPGTGLASSNDGGATGSGIFTAPTTPGTYKMGFAAFFSEDPVAAGFCNNSIGSQPCGITPFSYAEISFVVTGTACSDSLNNDSAQGADSADPQCHSDCNVNNAASYVPTHTSETTQVGSCPAPTLNLTGRSASLFNSFVSFFTNKAVAQEVQQVSNDTQATSNGGVIASVGIYSGAIKEVKLNTVEAGFTLKSDLGTQGGVLYGLVIKKKDTQEVVDTVAGEGVITLKYAEYAYKTLSYTAPVTLGGEHDVYLIVTTDSNIPLATKKLGSHTFTKSRDTKTFVKECTFDTKAFTATCVAGNRDKVSPSDTFLAIDVRKGGMFGTLSKTQKIVPLTFDVKGFATNTFPISQESGVHALDVTLVQGQTPLSHMAYEYTIEGNEVTIDNVFVEQADKKVFSVGVISLSPSKEAKTVMVSLTRNGKVLAQSSAAFSRPRTDVLVSYKGFSQPDAVAVSVTDASGTVLAEKMVPYASPFEKSGSAAAGWGGIIVLAIIALGYIVSLLRRKV
jgi:hypothetical protein